MASLASVPSGSSQVGVDHDLPRESRRLISAGRGGAVEGHEISERNQRGTLRGRHGDPEITHLGHVLAQALRQPQANIDRLARLVLVGRDRLAADQHTERTGHRWCRGRSWLPLTVDRQSVLRQVCSIAASMSTIPGTLYSSRLSSPA